MAGTNLRLAAVLAAGFITGCGAGPGSDNGDRLAQIEPEFVGGEACSDCHEPEYRTWLGSDHDKAMDVATEATVLGDFNDATFTYGGVTSRFFRRDGKFFVNTQGPDGEMADFEISHVFGHDPLQQYLIEFPGGRLQALNITWDVEGGEWFKQYPDQDIPPGDWLHWTRGGQNWNGMCAECHSTNLKKGYEPASDTFNTTWTDIDVNCEACHGPGSRHVAWAEIPEDSRPETAGLGLAVATSQIGPQRFVEICAPCHSRRSELGDYDHSESELLDFMLPSLLDDGLYHPDGQILDEVYVYGSFLQSRMYARGVSCQDCHDSHSLELRRTGNALCTGCHIAQRYDTTDHHFHKKDVGGVELKAEAAQCISCHMVEKAYMVIDWRGDHSFRVPRPDLSVELGTPNACSQLGCHADKPAQWSAAAVSRWYGDDRQPNFGSSFAAARMGDPAALPGLMAVLADDSTSSIVRATTLQLLSGLPGSQPAAVLGLALESPVPLERQAAAYATPLRSEEEIGRLASLLADPVKAVRLAVVGRLAGVSRDLLEPHQRTAFDIAFAEYRESMEHTFDFPSSNFNMGNIEASLGDSEKAEEYYRRALRIDDLFSPAKMNLAVLLSSQTRYDEAEQLLREVLRDYPNHVSAQYSLALLLIEMGRQVDGAEMLQNVIELQPDNARARYNLGLLLQQMGRMREAELQLRAAMNIQPDGLSYIHAYADFLYGAGRLEEALILADRMIELYPDQPVGQQLKTAILSGEKAD